MYLYLEIQNTNNFWTPSFISEGIYVQIPTLNNNVKLISTPIIDGVSKGIAGYNKQCSKTNIS